jgi:predicted TIM-barrel fold metal-dependent hydrolase
MTPNDPPLKIIGVEEHLWTPSIRDRLMAMPFDDHGVFYNDALINGLDDVGAQRLSDMEAMGVDMQILSITTPSVQVLTGQEAIDLAHEANDTLARIVADDPGHYACLATLPTSEPAAAVEELERAVTELGHRGVMLHGRTGEKFIDHADYAPIFAKAAELEVPIHLHPQRPIKAIADQYYMNNMPMMAGRVLSMFGWGWHNETAINVLRLITSGALDQGPVPQFILGHWGELIPFFLERIDEMTGIFVRDLPRSFAETFLAHFSIAPAGIWSYPMLNHAIAELGADRILFSVDYPFHNPVGGGARRFLEAAPLSDGDKHKIGHRNAERLFKLDLVGAVAPEGSN